VRHRLRIEGERPNFDPTSIEYSQVNLFRALAAAWTTMARPNGDRELHIDETDRQ